jgi:hypothetical protein
MKAKDLAKILLKHPELDVELANYSYTDSDSSVGYYDFQEVETVSITAKKAKSKQSIILSTSHIGYPEEKLNFTVLK